MPRGQQQTSENIFIFLRSRLYMYHVIQSIYYIKYIHRFFLELILHTMINTTNGFQQCTRTISPEEMIQQTNRAREYFEPNFFIYKVHKKNEEKNCLGSWAIANHSMWSMWEERFWNYWPCNLKPSQCFFPSLFLSKHMISEIRLTILPFTSIQKLVQSS